jgi:hypothetical protein
MNLSSYAIVMTSPILSYCFNTSNCRIDGDISAIVAMNGHFVDAHSLQWLGTIY